MNKNKTKFKRKTLAKVLTSIKGLDEITDGGLPKGRPTLICGDAGCGKTLFAMEFIVHGATMYNEPGVFISFEETEKELTANVASLGFDLDDLVSKKKLWLEHIFIDRGEIEEKGEYDLKGLFVRIHHAIESTKAKRVVLDTIESLFSALPNPIVIRTELRRLFGWLKKKGVTAIITGERGNGSLTRQGLEEYVSDCVILLDHRVHDQSSIRRLRIVKYRGSIHGTNEYPFLIDEDGFSILPVTSLGLNHISSNERISTGIPRLDTMFSGKGYYRGSTILVSGTAGTGKTSLAAQFVEAACKRGERVLYFAFEESPSQFMRNMSSIGIDLEPHVKKGILHFHATRPTLYGLEHHLTTTIKLINKFKPRIVVLDPIDAFIMGDNRTEVKIMLLRLVDFLKGNNITAFFANLTNCGNSQELTDMAISSLIDTWLLLRDIEIGGERNRGLYILKSRGMSHSNQIREFKLTDKGIDLLDVYVGPEGVLTGTARISQETKNKEEQLQRKQEIERKQIALNLKRAVIDAQIVVLQSEYKAEESETLKIIDMEKAKTERFEQHQKKMAESRKADLLANAQK
ncbi:MAG: circadian clock protein KaiC [Bacteroidetes bacterium]|nr:circadian clock protein KaiC [Bacteroidota bacterium]MBU1114189.1 circadian clock protein KaiC [Bacteroidota bacterium]MBU1796951.1 circadian clock protein KaiC [Bacteroidota bacterium]